MIFLSGCAKNQEDNSKKQLSANKDYDIFIYNSDTSIGKAFREMCDEYTKKTGVIIRTVTPSEEESTYSNLESFISSEYPPSIFTLNSIDELKLCQQSENIWDFNNATQDSFKEMVNTIPEGMRLSSNSSDSFGVPTTLEGYGFVVDPKMLSSLFGGDKYRKVINDLKSCTYEEFNYFVEALNSYISSGAISEFKLNEKDYTFLEAGRGLSKNLKGVFSFSGSNSKIFGSYIMNPILASVFSLPSDAYNAGEDEINSLENPISKYVELLDFISSNVAGETSKLNRGSELISTSKNSTAQSIKNFVKGKSVFLIATTKDYENMSIFDSLAAKRCIFIPFKVPITDYDLDSSGKSLDKNLNKSLGINVPRYFCINSRATDHEKKVAQDFLVWYASSDLAKKYIVSEFGYVPYNIDDGSILDNPLERSMIDYIKENKFLPPVFSGAPKSWPDDIMGKYVVNSLLNKSYWNYEDYENTSKYAIDEWKKLKNNQ